jgi:hypothetical protein
VVPPENYQTKPSDEQKETANNESQPFHLDSVSVFNLCSIRGYGNLRNEAMRLAAHGFLASPNASP